MLIYAIILLVISAIGDEIDEWSLDFVYFVSFCI